VIFNNSESELMSVPSLFGTDPAIQTMNPSVIQILLANIIYFFSI
jgi:hypothetical protein